LAVGGPLNSDEILNTPSNKVTGQWVGGGLLELIDWLQTFLASTVAWEGRGVVVRTQEN